MIVSSPIFTKMRGKLGNLSFSDIRRASKKSKKTKEIHYSSKVQPGKRRSLARNRNPVAEKAMADAAKLSDQIIQKKDILTQGYKTNQSYFNTLQSAILKEFWKDPNSQNNQNFLFDIPFIFSTVPFAHWQLYAPSAIGGNQIILATAWSTIFNERFENPEDKLYGICLNVDLNYIEVQEAGEQRQDGGATIGFNNPELTGKYYVGAFFISETSGIPQPSLLTVLEV